MHYTNVECFFVYIVKDKSIANGRFCHGVLLNIKTSRDVNLVSIVGFWLICLNSLRVAQIYGRLRIKLADIHVRVLLLKCKPRCINCVCSLDSVYLYFIHVFIPTICICMWRMPVAPGYRPGSLRGISHESSVFLLFCHRGQCCERSCTLKLTVAFALRLSWAKTTTTAGDNVILLEHQWQAWQPASVCRQRSVLATNYHRISRINPTNLNAFRHLKSPLERKFDHWLCHRPCSNICRQMCSLLCVLKERAFCAVKTNRAAQARQIYSKWSNLFWRSWLLHA